MSAIKNKDMHTAYVFCNYTSIQWTLVTTTAFVPKYVAILNLLLYRILNEQIGTYVRNVLFCSYFLIEHMYIFDIC